MNDPKGSRGDLSLWDVRSNPAMEYTYGVVAIKKVETTLKCPIKKYILSFFSYPNYSHKRGILVNRL
jgi:hypothetical protein